MLKSLFSLVIITLIATNNAATYDCKANMELLKLAMSTVKDLNTCPDA